ncbi:MAG: SDR family NAD(P)-dependent oxidoreductase, partial [Actinomycetota bacterium]|nr:SDR family NAD(P)-dependent oxidoreductase [Actinomycetota bacterium]
MPNALITGASQGLGRAIGVELARRGWSIIADARTETDLADAAAELEAAGAAQLVTRVGSIADAAHRDDLRGVVASLGGLDLLVN